MLVDWRKLWDSNGCHPSVKAMIGRRPLPFSKIYLLPFSSFGQIGHVSSANTERTAMTRQVGWDEGSNSVMETGAGGWTDKKRWELRLWKGAETLRPWLRLALSMQQKQVRRGHSMIHSTLGHFWYHFWKLSHVKNNNNPQTKTATGTSEKKGWV